MADILFRIHSTDAERDAILEDLHRLLSGLSGSVDSRILVEESETDSVLRDAWMEDHGVGEAHTVSIRIAVERNDWGSLSGLAMHCAQAFLIPDPEDAKKEPLQRLVEDNPGTSRVPWHLELRP